MNYYNFKIKSLFFQTLEMGHTVVEYTRGVSILWTDGKLLSIFDVNYGCWVC